MEKLFRFMVVFLTIVLVSCKATTIKASSLVVSSDVVYVNVDAELSINVTVLPSDASDKTMEWISAEQTIATVNQEGVISGVKVGETKVTIKVRAVPTVSTTISVHVVDQNLPNDRILAFAGFELPAFTDFSFVEVEEAEDILTLNIKGTSADAAAISAFKDALLAIGLGDKRII